MKLKISKVLDVSKFLPTQAGDQLKDLILYLGEFTQQIVQAVGGKLNFADNFLSEIKTINVISNEVLTVSVNGKRISNLFIIRSLDPAYYVIERFGWKYDNEGNLSVVIGLLGNPEQSIPVEILILY